MSRMRMTALGVFSGLSLLAVPVLIAQASSDLLDTPRVLVENERVHSHGRGLTMALSNYDNETRVPGVQWVRSRAMFGDVKWPEPVTREARRSGVTAQRVVRGEGK